MVTSKTARGGRGSPSGAKGKKLPPQPSPVVSLSSQPSLLYYPIEYAAATSPSPTGQYQQGERYTSPPSMDNSSGDNDTGGIVLMITFFIFLVLLIILLIGGICMWNTPCSSDEVFYYTNQKSSGSGPGSSSGSTTSTKAVRFSDGRPEEDGEDEEDIVHRRQLEECPKALLEQILQGSSTKRQRQDQAVILAFVAPWCGYCQQLKPTLREAGKRSKIPIYTVTHKNNDETKHVAKAATQLDVKGFPMIFKIQNKKAMVYSGDRSLESILEFANKNKK